jgi:hypothetical protein
MFNGEPGAVPKVIGHWMLRSALMMPGLALAGVRDKRLVTGALLSSTFVSLFLIAYTGFERRRPSRHKRSLQGHRKPYKRPTKESEPVFFVDPETGDVVELDHRTAEYKKLRGRGRNRLAGNGKLGATYRVTVRHRKLPGQTSLCVSAANKAAATALVQDSSRGVKILRIARGC